MISEKTRALLEEAVTIAVGIAYHGPEALQEAVRAETLAEALKRWEELIGFDESCHSDEEAAMQLSIEIKLDPELKTLAERLIEVLCDLATIIAPLTGYRVIPDEGE